MEYEVLIREYIKCFILVIETIGQANGNKRYQDVGNIVMRNKEQIEFLIKQEPPVTVLINALIVMLIGEIHDSSEVSGVENIPQLNDLVDDLYLRYLEGPTNKFMKKYGMPIIKKPSDFGISMLIKG